MIGYPAVVGFVSGYFQHIWIQIKAGYAYGSFGGLADSQGQITRATAEIKNSFRIVLQAGLDGMPAAISCPARR